MANHWTTIQMSKDFKQTLKEEKEETESFERYIKRMRKVFLKFLGFKNEDR